MAYDITSTIWFWVAFAVYLAILAIIGYISHRKTKTITDFLVASRGIGTVLLGLSYGVTYFSAVLLVGCPGLTWLLGNQWTLVTLMNLAFGTFAAFLILGNKSRRMSKKLGALTLPELIAERYQDKKLIRPTAGLVIAVFQTIYLVSIFMGLSTLLQVLFPGVAYAFQIAVILCGVITCLYLIIGGSHSAILSDLVESIIMIVGVVGITIGGIISVGGLANMNANIIADINAQGGYFGADPEIWYLFPNIMSMSMIGMAFVTTFGTWGSPQMATRFFTSKDRKSIRYGMVISCIWVFIVSFCAWFNGAVGRGLSPNSTVELQNWAASFGATGNEWREYVMPWMLVEQNILPLAFTALFLAAVTERV
ncbi:MAG: sodium:solute symporter family transporter [Candidatus Helarchaeota archaeon]